MSDIGALAAALAKAQSQFPAITRDKTVTVQMRTGGSYKFKYAPLDSILAATRKPLTDNGLALVQLIDEGALVTQLLHESGAVITGALQLPPTPQSTADIQALGSAITYLRRYAIQAILGIAAEEDDDGNRAAGNIAESDERPRPAAGETAPTPADGLIGTVDVRDEWLGDLQLRNTPEGPVVGFRLKQGRQTLKVQAHGALAVACAALDLTGKTVTAWGTLVGQEFTPKGTNRAVPYQILRLGRLHGADFDIPAPEPDDAIPVAPGQETIFSDEEQRALDEALAGVVPG